MIEVRSVALALDNVGGDDQGGDPAAVVTERAGVGASLVEGDEQERRPRRRRSR